jgi:hypothetical protein
MPDSETIVLLGEGLFATRVRGCRLMDVLAFSELLELTDLLSRVIGFDLELSEPDLETICSVAVSFPLAF